MNKSYTLNGNSKIKELDDLIKKNQLFLKYKNITINVISVKKTNKKIPLIINSEFIYHFNDGFFIYVENQFYSIVINNILKEKLNKLFNPKNIKSIQYYESNIQSKKIFYPSKFIHEKYRKYTPFLIKKFLFHIIILLKKIYFLFFKKKNYLFDFSSSNALHNLKISNRKLLLKKFQHVDAEIENINSKYFFNVFKKEKIVNKEIKLCAFKKCFLDTRSYLIFDSNKNYYYDKRRWEDSYYFTELNFNLSINREKDYIYFNSSNNYSNNQPIFLRNVINFCDPLIKNFSHFLTEFLPMMIEIGKHSEYDNYSFLLPSGIHSNILDYINIFTKKKRRLIFVDSACFLQINNMVQLLNFSSIKFHPLNRTDYLKPSYYTNHININVMIYIRKKINSKLKNTTGFFSSDKIKKTFIVRSSVGRNTNNKLITKIIHDYNFNKANFYNLNIFEQAKIFKYSSIIIGITGSEFSNLIHLGHNSKVFIIVPSANIHWIYKYWSALNKSNNIIFITDSMKKISKFKSTRNIGSEKINYKKLYSIFIEIIKKGYMYDKPR